MPLPINLDAASQQNDWRWQVIFRFTVEKTPEQDLIWRFSGSYHGWDFESEFGISGLQGPKSRFEGRMYTRAKVLTADAPQVTKGSVVETKAMGVYAAPLVPGKLNSVIMQRIDGDDISVWVNGIKVIDEEPVWGTKFANKLTFLTTKNKLSIHEFGVKRYRVDNLKIDNVFVLKNGDTYKQYKGKTLGDFCKTLDTHSDKLRYGDNCASLCKATITDDCAGNEADGGEALAAVPLPPGWPYMPIGGVVSIWHSSKHWVEIRSDILISYTHPGTFSYRAGCVCLIT